MFTTPTNIFIVTDTSVVAPSLIQSIQNLVRTPPDHIWRQQKCGASLVPSAKGELYDETVTHADLCARGQKR